MEIYFAYSEIRRDMFWWDSQERIMADTGQIDEDLYSLRETKKYIGDIYNRRIHEKGGVHESDGYADALGDVIKHLDRAAKERESEKSPADATPAAWWAARSNS